MAEHELRQNGLLFARKARHVGIFENIGRMLVVAGVGDVHADFVQKPRPIHILLPISQFLHRRVVRQANAFHKLAGGVGHAAGLVEADMIALLKLRGGLVAHVFVELAADKIVKHAIAQSSIGNHHFFDVQLFKCGHHHRQPAGKHFDAVGLEPFETRFFGAARFNNARGDFLHAGIGDFFVITIFGGNHIADGFGRAGGAHGKIPAGAFQ